MTKSYILYHSRHCPLLTTNCCTDCVSSANLLKDGHRAGKKNRDAELSISEHLVPRCNTDSTTHAATLKPHRVVPPWF